MTYSAFVGTKVQYNNGKYDSIKHAAKDRYDPDAPSLLLEDDVTMEEVLEFKRVLEDDNGNEEVLIEKDYIYQDIYRQEEFQKTFLEPNTLRDQNRESDVMSQRLQQAEELLEKESKLMIEVSKKLEMFIEESKQRIAEDEPSDLSESIDKEIDIVKTVAEASVIAQPIQTKPKKGKKSKNTNPLLPAIPKDPKSRVRVQLQDKLGEAMVQANNVDEVLLDDDSDVNDREKRAGRSNLIKMNRFRKHYDDMNDFYLRSQENDVKRGDNKAKKNGRDDSD